MKKSLLLFSFLVTSGILFAQNSLQNYTPSVLLSKGQMEIKLFNNLYTQTKIRDQDGNDIEIGGRQSFFNNQFRFAYGVSNEKRINVGLEINMTSAKYAGDNDTNKDFNKTLLSSIGPTIKFIPIPNIGNFSIQSTFLFPVGGEDLEDPDFINHNRRTWFTQLFYDYSISDQLNVFFEADLLFRFKEEDTQTNFFRTPVSGIVSYFPTSKLTFYTLIQHAPLYSTVLPGGQEIDLGRISWYTQLGFGMKYQLLSSLELELSYGNFLWSKRDGAGQVFSLGLRFLR
jgi:hypothetical protein